MNETGSSEEHYLKRELYERIRTDPRILDFLEAGSLDGLWYWDVENPSEEWMSPRFKSLFGYEDHEVPNEASWWQKHIHPDDLPVAVENFRKHCEDPKHPYDQVVRYRHRDGSTVWVRCRGLAIRDEQGKAKRILGAHTDVTDFVRAAEEARRLNAELEERVEDRTAELRAQMKRNAPLAAIVACSPDAILHKDLDGTIRAWNLGAERMYGYLAEEIVGQNVSILVPEDLQAELAEILEKVTRGERVEDLETRRLTKDGKEIWVSITLSPVFGADGESLGASTIARDVTARREQQQRLEELNAELEQYALELERSNFELEQFAYVASHDLREPLRMVRSFCTLLEENYAEALDEEGRQFIAFAVDGAQRMQEMIDSLLEYSRVSREELTPVPTPTMDIVADVEHVLAASIEESAAEIVYADLPVVMGNRALLNHVFQNLISNAIKFRADTKPPKIEISARRQDAEWVFAVRDEGIGIERDHLDDIFQVFCRLHTRDRYPGTGVGLALCKRIIERHGGRIWVESEPGVGSTFWFALPAGDGTGSRRSPPAIRARMAASVRGRRGREFTWPTEEQVEAP